MISIRTNIQPSVYINMHHIGGHVWIRKASKYLKRFKKFKARKDPWNNPRGSALH